VNTVGVRALAVDVALVVVFVLIGRRSHEESGALLGLARTAWPFLAGLAAGWLAARAWRRPLRLWPEAVVVWLATVALGMVLRVVSGQGTAFSFVVVTLVVLAVFLLGWRALLPVAARLRTRT
jgi:peptidoglycan/LPS O-acetylase OafA/YrhL